MEWEPGAEPLRDNLKEIGAVPDFRGRERNGGATSRSEGGHPIRTPQRLERPFALVLGNEEEGLRPAILKACDEIVTIPGAGSVQSLNVAASAPILIYTMAPGHD